MWDQCQYFDDNHACWFMGYWVLVNLWSEIIFPDCFQTNVCLSLVFVHFGDKDLCVNVNTVSSCVLLRIAGTILLLKL